MNRHFTFGAPAWILALMLLPGISAAQTICTNEAFDTIAAPSLPVGWSTESIVDPSSIGTAGLWVNRAQPAYVNSPPNAMFVDDYSAQADVRLYSPTYAVGATGTPSITFRHAYQLWAPASGGVYDGAVLELSINGGAYVDLVTAGGTFTAGGYSRQLDPAFDNPIAQTAPFNRPVWGGDSAGFVTTTAVMPVAALGNTVKLRLRLGLEDGGRAIGIFAGWWFDTLDCASLPVSLQSYRVD